MLLGSCGHLMQGGLRICSAECLASDMGGGLESHIGASLPWSLPAQCRWPQLLHSQCKQGNRSALQGYLGSAVLGCMSMCTSCVQSMACEGLSGAWLTCVYVSELRSKAGAGPGMRCTRAHMEALIAVVVG